MAATGYTPIQLYYSTTAAAVPVNTNLANGELAINITDGKLYYKNNSGTVTLLAGATGAIAPITANGVVYVNSSGQATSGSALVFDGTNLGLGSSTINTYYDRTQQIYGTASSSLKLTNATAGTANTDGFDVAFSGTTGLIYNRENGDIAFGVNNTEGMRLTSTGLGIGTSSPSARLQINGTTDATQRIIVNGTGNVSSYKLNYNGSEVGFIQNYQNTEMSIGTTVAASLGFNTNNTQRFVITSAGALGIGATPSYGTSGQVLTSGGSAAAPTWTTVSGGGSAATPGALGTVYGKTDTTSVAFLGYQAGSSTTGINNVFIGFQSAYSTTSGTRNTFIGYQAGYSNLSGSNNVFIGFAAGQSTTGTDNTFVGSRGSAAGGGAGNAVTTGSRHTLIGQYDGNQDGLDIRTANNYAVISDGAGNRQLSMYEGGTVALDSAVPNAGTGITFPATQSASTDANTLDDYEEGTWTPAYSPGSGAFATITYYVQYGTYQKIGNTVSAQMYFYLTNYSVGTASGQLVITGLPFTPAGATGYQSGLASYTYNWATNSPTKTIVYQSDTRLYLVRDDQGAALYSSPDILVSNLKNGNPACILSASITYKVA